MRRKNVFRIACAAALLGLAWHGVARSEDPAPEAPTGTAPLPPQRVETSEPPSPVTMLATDARRLLEQVHVERATPAPAAQGTAGGPEGPPSRVIHVEPAGPVVNFSDRFVFRPLHRAPELTPPAVPLEQRRATVERFRRQLERNRDEGRR